MQKKDKNRLRGKKGDHPWMAEDKGGMGRTRDAVNAELSHSVHVLLCQGALEVLDLQKKGHTPSSSAPLSPKKENLTQQSS